MTTHEPTTDDLLLDALERMDTALRSVMARLDALEQRPVGLRYRGVYAPDQVYETGDGVTWAGSLFVAMEPTSAKPGEAGQDSRAWRLAVKRGKAGAPGRDGRDLTR